MNFCVINIVSVRRAAAAIRGSRRAATWYRATSRESELELPDRGYVRKELFSRTTTSSIFSSNFLPPPSSITSPILLKMSRPVSVLDNALGAVGYTPLIRLDKIASAEGLQCNLRGYRAIHLSSHTKPWCFCSRKG